MKRKLFLFSAIASIAIGLLAGCTTAESHPSRVVTKFLNYDESVLYVNTIPYGEDAIYQGEKPVRESSETTVYTFSGWDKPLDKIVEDTTFYAQYTDSVRKYEIKFVDYDDTLLEKQSLEYGSTPVYSQGEPTRSSDDYYTYAFTGWSPAIEKVKSDKTYKATYSREDILYTITWNVDGATTTEKYRYGETPSFKGSTDKASTAQYSYEFSGWEPSIRTVTANTTYTAKYNQSINSYTITWNVDGKVTSESYEYGATPTYKGSTDKASTAQYTYTFAGWSPAISAVTSNATYTAQYDSVVNSYTITWDVDGNITYETYKYGDAPSFKGSTSKEADAQYSYTFKGWSPEIVVVTKNATYTALYENTLNKYTVKWLNDNDGILKTETYNYGETPNYGSTPTSSDDYGYETSFIGWSPEIQPVTSDIEYKAQYSKTPKKFNLSVAVPRNWDATHWGEVYLFSEEYDYGTLVPVNDIIAALPEGFADFNIDSLNHWIYHKFVQLSLPSYGYGGGHTYVPGEKIEINDHIQLQAEYITSECGRYPTTKINDGLRLDSVPCDYYWEYQNTFMIPGKVDPQGENGGYNIVTEIGSYAFSYSGSEPLTLKVGDGVKRIDSYAFNSERIVSLSLPNTLTSLDAQSLCGCYSLSDLTFRGTKKAWNDLTKGSGWNSDISASVVHCSDGDITL